MTTPVHSNFCKCPCDQEDDRGLQVSQENPLLNHLVASKILSFGQFTFEELKKFRLVCTLWYTLSLDQWRQSVSLRIVESGNDERESKADKLVGVTIADLCHFHNENQELFQLSRKPYKRYKLKGWTSGYRLKPTNARDEMVLWRDVLAPCVKFLRIESCYFPDSKLVEDRLFACVNLRELVLVGNSSGICRGYNIPTEVSDELPVLTNLEKLTVSGAMPLQWSKLLLHTPHLESLTIKQHGPYYRTTFASFLLDLHQLEFSGRNPQNIKHLDIMNADDTFTDFVSLASRNLKLESLSAHYEKVRPEHFMQPLLHAHSRTLKILKLCRVSNRCESPFGQFEFPYSVNLPNLTELHLWGNIVQNMDFLRYTPNLKILYVSRDRSEKKHLLRFWGSGESGENIPEDLVSGQNEIPEDVDRFKMESMEVLHIDCKFSVESLKCLRKWMPKLQKIAAGITNDTLKIICDEWQDIKEIKGLYGSDVDNNKLSYLTKTSRNILFQQVNKRKPSEGESAMLADLTKIKLSGG